jgi:hypothetical protein
MAPFIVAAFNWADCEFAEGKIKPVEQAEAVMNDYVSSLKKNTSNQTNNANTSHCYLTGNDELASVQLCHVLEGSMF